MVVGYYFFQPGKNKGPVAWTAAPKSQIVDFLPLLPLVVKYLHLAVTAAPGMQKIKLIGSTTVINSRRKSILQVNPALAVKMAFKSWATTPVAGMLAIAAETDLLGDKPSLPEIKRRRQFILGQFTVEEQNI